MSEEKAKQEAALKAKQEAEEKAKQEAALKAKQEAEEKAKQEAALKAKQEAELNKPKDWVCTTQCIFKGKLYRDGDILIEVSQAELGGALSYFKDLSQE